VLAAAGITHWVEPSGSGYVLVVDAADRERAGETLGLYERENRSSAVPDGAEVEYGYTSAAWIVAVVLLAFYAFTGPSSHAGLWFDLGAASARKIVTGQPWRAVTALFLHADASHIGANAVTCILFGTALCRIVGPGVGILLMLIAGAGGNLVNAYIYRDHHIAVGASTAVFGAVGALGGLQLRRGWARARGWRAWLPIAAALGLLAWLGAAPETDVTAHLLGFAIGAVGGVVAALPGRPLATGPQLTLALVAALLVFGSWWMALS